MCRFPELRCFLKALIAVCFAFGFVATRSAEPVPAAAISPRLVGSEVDAKDGEFPYQVSLRIRGEHVCGGALLSRRWIVTSGHCVTKHEIRSFIIVLGSNSLISGGFAFRAQEARLHPEYVQQDHHHDIALVKISSACEYSRAIAPIKLPSSQLDDHVPKLLTFTSWPSATRSSSRPVPSSINNFNLKVLRVPTVRLEDCKTVFPSVTSSNVCTLSRVKGQGLCYGDAGSPLASNGILYAIGSWGAPCALSYPDVHTRIIDHVDWIEDWIECDDED